jgi:hypothetical protein
MRYGRDHSRLSTLLAELGPGDFDPLVGAGTPGDGLLRVEMRGATQVFAFDPLRRPESVACPGPGSVARPSPESVASTTSFSDEDEPHDRETSADTAVPSANGRVLDRPFPKESTRIDEVLLADELGRACLHAAPLGGHLLRVSVGLPEWRQGDWLRPALKFCDALENQGALGVLLVLDRSSKNVPHWYGLTLMGGARASKEARDDVRDAWVRASGAHYDAIDVVTVTGWRAFLETGSLDAAVGRRAGTFRANLGRVVAYALKEWPPGFGHRNPDADVLSRGLFARALELSRGAVETLETG